MGPLLILIRHLLRTPSVIIQTLHICDLHTIGRTRILDRDPQPLTLILRLREVAVGNVARLSPNDRVEPLSAIPRSPTSPNGGGCSSPKGSYVVDIEYVFF